jgi:hypothetical protein
MEWTVKDAPSANHNPDVVVNGTGGKEPVTIDAVAGVIVTLDASATRDPDGNVLRYRWWFYPEAGTGIPGQPVFAGGVVPAGGTVDQGGIPSAPAGGAQGPPSRVTIAGATTSKAVVTPRIAGTAHVILEVEDDGTPSLTSYRRVILKIKPTQ